MRLARLRVEGRSIVAIEHRGLLYRVDRLDRALGAPVPDELRAQAGLFQTRVFAMGGVGLDDHEVELDDGTMLDDCCVEPGTLLAWLPPWGEGGTLHELGPGDELPRPIGGRAVRGHEVRAPGLEAGALQVSPALALIVRDDLHLPGLDEVERALFGVSLGLAWRSPEAGQRGFDRLPGTHLGPWLVTPVPGGEVALTMTARGGRPAVQARVALGPIVARAARALTALGRHQDLTAGDAVLALLPDTLEVEPGETVTLIADGVGELRGRVG